MFTQNENENYRGSCREKIEMGARLDQGGRLRLDREKINLKYFCYILFIIKDFLI
jgi:hypothetical protein